MPKSPKPITKKSHTTQVGIVAFLLVVGLITTYVFAQSLQRTNTYDQSRASETVAEYPSNLIDLNFWKLNIPVNTSEVDGDPDEINNEGKPGQPVLNTYTHNSFFKLNNNRSAVTFYSPAQGATTGGSKNPRSELRERRDISNEFTFDEEGCQAQNKPKEACWSSFRGYHIMTVDQAVLEIPIKKPHVVVGQIHDLPDDVTVFRLEGKHLFVDTNRYNSAPDFTLTRDYNLGDRFSIAFEVENDVTAFYYNGQRVGQLNERYDSAYFKAGMYVQSTEGLPAGGKVDVYDLKVCHAATKDGCSHVQPKPPGEQPPTVPPTPSPTPSASPRVTPTPTPSASPRVTPTPTPSPRPTSSPSIRPTSSPVPSPSPITSGKITGLVASSSKDSEAKLTWNAYTGAKKYRVFVDKYRNGDWSEEKSTSSTNATIKDLKSNQISFFRVKAYDSKNKEIAVSDVAATKVK